MIGTSNNGFGSDLLAARFRQVDEIVGMDLPDPGQDHLTVTANDPVDLTRTHTGDALAAMQQWRLASSAVPISIPSMWIPSPVPPDYTARVEAMRFALQSMPADPGRARDISEIMKRARDIHQFFVETHPGEGSRQAREAPPG